jgi:hypothetical protein
LSEVTLMDVHVIGVSKMMQCIRPALLFVLKDATRRTSVCMQFAVTYIL